MAPGLRTFFVVLLFGQGAFLYWMSGSYRPGSTEAGERKPVAKSLTVWEAEKPAGKFWATDQKTVVTQDGHGVEGKGKALAIAFDGPDYRGCGVNWKGWFPSDACDDVSRHRSLVFWIRQTTAVADADLTVRLTDNVKRNSQEPASNGLSVLVDGAVSRIDGEWRKVVLPLEKFAKNAELDLRRVWGVDFSDASGRPLGFHIDRIGFGDDSPPYPKFPPTSGYAVTARVEVGSPTHSIRDDIYGACELPQDKIAAYGLSQVRWGGNRSSRFNWKVNADNAGKDWFFKNGGTPVKDPAESGWPRFLRANAAVGAGSYITVPTLGYVSKDHISHAFSVRKYGKQQSVEMGHPDVGNGIAADGRFITRNDWRDTSVEASAEFIKEGVAAAVTRAGPGGKPRYWVLDNEPMLWHETHRDVRRTPVSYDELWERTVTYAEAIRAADPDAKIAGFCSWGWTDLFNSAADEGGDQYRTQPDFRKHGNVPLAEWFIKQCGDYKRKHGKPLVDVFDFHWYPQAEHNGRGPYLGTGMDKAFNALRLRTTRDLWDAGYEPESWIKDAAHGEPTRLLPRVREWVDKHNPGMEICVGEYNFGGGDNISGALAQADTFGILARERADLAFIWTRPEGTQELAWKLFRNYDGDGSRFGDRHLVSQSPNADLSVHAAKRSADGATTIVVVNKSLGGCCSLKLNVPGLQGTARVWRFDQETGENVVAVESATCTVNGVICLTLPAASGTMIVVR